MPNICIYDWESRSACICHLLHTCWEESTSSLIKNFLSALLYCINFQDEFDTRTGQASYGASHRAVSDGVREPKDGPKDIL